MSRLAIFTAPKPFTNPHIRTIQRNAIHSWQALGSEVEVWLVGDEAGVAETASEFGVGYIADVQRNTYGTPRIDSIFNTVREKSGAPYLCYVNADILLFQDMLQTLNLAHSSYQRFLLIGQRWDAPITTEPDIQPGWEEFFIPDTLRSAVLHTAVGSDYFVFPRNEFADIPAFAVGRAGWDNWMIFQARLQKMAVINATGGITAIHQNHDFSHLPGGKIHRYQPESLENLTLAGGRERMFTLYDTNKVIHAGSIGKPAFARERLVREISIFPLLHIRTKWLANALYALLNPRQAIRDRQKDLNMKKSINDTLKGSKL
jgi:hypothetical protein